jgi:hypothetical protein
MIDQSDLSSTRAEKTGCSAPFIRMSRLFCRVCRPEKGSPLHDLNPSGSFLFLALARGATGVALRQFALFPVASRRRVGNSYKSLQSTCSR